MAALSITWFGHATFLLTSPGGKHIVFDPWLTGNPKAPAGAKIGKVHDVGLAAGCVVRMEDGRAVYFAGDTSIFGDMRLIKELYAPEIAFLPIGDHYTMDPAAAAKACEMLGVRQVVPMHYGTFPALSGSPDALKKLVEPMGVDVLVLKPGETAS